MKKKSVFILICILAAAALLLVLYSCNGCRCDRSKPVDDPAKASAPVSNETVEPTKTVIPESTASETGAPETPIPTPTATPTPTPTPTTTPTATPTATPTPTPTVSPIGGDPDVEFPDL